MPKRRSPAEMLDPVKVRLQLLHDTGQSCLWTCQCSAQQERKPVYTCTQPMPVVSLQQYPTYFSNLLSRLETTQPQRSTYTMSMAAKMLLSCKSLATYRARKWPLSRVAPDVSFHDSLLLSSVRAERALVKFHRYNQTITFRGNKSPIFRCTTFKMAWMYSKQNFTVVIALITPPHTHKTTR